MGAASIEAASFYEQLSSKQKKYWHKLIHYKKNILGHKSIVDGKDFFLHEDGVKDPEKEFVATILKFKNPNLLWGKYKQPIQCAFPERFRFINSLNLIEFKKVKCHQFEEWKNGINAESITLVFSSSYPNNPASLFGHTFIRFNQTGKKNDLLDYGVAYSADVNDSDWAPFYAYKGLFGGYPGFYEISKYYQLVNTYISAESRDLWEFDLNIPKEGVSRILNHIWEIYSTTYFDYYFISENCSKILGATLEIANPEWNFSDSERFFYLPHDLVKLTSKIPGMVKNINFRPSIKKKFQGKFNSLSNIQKENVEEIYKEKKSVEKAETLEELDTLIALINFRKFKEKGEITKNQKVLLRQSLIKRAKFKKSKKDYIIPEDYVSNRPDLAHEPRQFKLGHGIKNDQSVSSLSYRLGYHDLADRDEGVLSFSQFELFDINFNMYWDDLSNKNTQRINLERARVVGITSLHQYTFYDPQLSWKADFVYRSIDEFTCNYCHKFVGEGGAGFSFFLGGNRSIVYLMLGAYSEVSDHFQRDYTLGGWLEWKVATAPVDSYKFVLGHTVRSNFRESFSDDFYSTLTMQHNFFPNRMLTVGLESSWVSRVGSWTRQTYKHELSLGWYF